ncbi:MAG: glycosyl hydrolase [Flavobacteriales bacterium TMED96]|nr:MAG: glycosyl hydrolase [Flavobacteriales bacterium TMED96]
MIYQSKKKLGFLFLFFVLTAFNSFSQNKRKSKSKEYNKVSLTDFNFRNIGPAFLSGRIADIAIDSKNENIWYVAVGSGGVWKTLNSGTTWIPLFDDENSYSTGCVTIDPNNSATIWVGTGENVGGRHVAYGDGIYKSDNGGKSWINMGLKKTEHISKIIVHPENSNIVWVVAQGPLWKKGGQRGVYKTINGGKNWKKVLGNSQWTGATDILIDPRNPNVLYAATWDRHRTVAAFMGGGPGSGIHKSVDGGETWKKLHKGLPNDRDSNGDGKIDEDDLPTVNMGKIGLAISPQKPDVLYAAIELERTTGGVYKSEDSGESWNKMSNAVSGATGPHYYQELYASPHKFDRLYLMNVRVLTSEDGGKTFEQLKENKKHSDNHVIAFKKNDPDYLLIGTDAGIYESFDLAENWRYIKNLPLTQFYKVAVNNAEPFYHIFGGTQDNGSAGGPSATDEIEGISNKHWYKTLFADGHQSATDPEFNNLIYAETQQGGLHRIDLITGEQTFIQPQAGINEPHERFNWDAPIIVSPHNPSTIYFGSYRVWKSENRGDSWIPISGDLTRNENRIKLPIMGRKQSWENSWDVGAMSNYNTITSLSESPIKKGLIYAGTDDGFIQITKDGGENWKKIPVTSLGLPKRSFVNDIKADIHDENIVYVVLDNHKEGDFNPYLFKSEDQGNSWVPISNDLPKRTLLWRIVQDHVNKNLFFLATEFGVYTSLNGCKNWQKLNGTPNMGFRDLVIQKRESDLVAASFGRGFYVLDDYSPLRNFSDENLKKKGHLFPIKDGKWFIQRSNLGNTGADFYLAENPKYGVTMTYHLGNNYETKSEKRKKSEKRLNQNLLDVPFPGYNNLDEEKNETPAYIKISIEDQEGNIVRHLKERAAEGTHRITWDLRHMFKGSVTDSNKKNNLRGPIVKPGKYSASLYLVENGETTKLSEKKIFELKPIYESILKGTSFKDYDNYVDDYFRVYNDVQLIEHKIKSANEKVNSLKMAIENTPRETEELVLDFHNLKNSLLLVKRKVFGNESKTEIGEKNTPTLFNRIRVASQGLSSSYGPTKLHIESLDMARLMNEEIKPLIKNLISKEVTSLENKIKDINGPVIIED